MKYYAIAALCFCLVGCVELEHPIADKEHSNKDDRILGSWSDGEYDLVVTEADNGGYQVVESKDGKEPRKSCHFYLITIDGLQYMSYRAEKGSGLRTESLVLLCDFAKNGDLQLYDLDAKKVSQAVKEQELMAKKTRLGVRLTSSSDEMRKWLKTAGRQAFEPSSTIDLGRPGTRPK